MMKKQIPARDLIKLSAYLDGQLSPNQAGRIATRLVLEPELRAALDDLRKTRSVLRAAPRLRSPHNFTLTAAMAGQPAKTHARFVPTYQLVSAVASLLFVLVVVGDLFTAGFSRMASPAEQAMPLMAEDQLPAVALEKEVVEAPAAAPPMETEADEMETFALEVETTAVVEQEVGTQDEEQAEKSELASEPIVEELGLPEPDSTPTLVQEPPSEEVLLMQEAPATDEPAANAKEAPADDASETLEEAVQEPGAETFAALPDASSEQILGEGVPLEDQSAGGAERAIGESAPRERASEPDRGREAVGTGWTLLRIAELGLALVALCFGALTWVSRRRG